jgi:hypothetical protein
MVTETVLGYEVDDAFPVETVKSILPGCEPPIVLAVVMDQHQIVTQFLNYVANCILRERNLRRWQLKFICMNPHFPTR